jgi:hypothetical protein
MVHYGQLLAFKSRGLKINNSLTVDRHLSYSHWLLASSKNPYLYYKKGNLKKPVNQ